MGKITVLFLSLLFDAIGMISYFFPGMGEVTDVLWAPLSGWLMTKLYKGKKGKIAGVITFVEEALPAIDLIPTFTIMWIYTYIITSNKDSK